MIDVQRPKWRLALAMGFAQIVSEFFGRGNRIYFIKLFANKREMIITIVIKMTGHIKKRLEK